jgi:hypothetical protein
LSAATRNNLAAVLADALSSSTLGPSAQPALRSVLRLLCGGPLPARALAQERALHQAVVAATEATR